MHACALGAATENWAHSGAHRVCALQRTTRFMAKERVHSQAAPSASDTPGLGPWSKVRKRPCQLRGTQRSATAVPTAPPAACATCTRLLEKREPHQAALHTRPAQSLQKQAASANALIVSVTQCPSLRSWPCWADVIAMPVEAGHTMRPRCTAERPLPAMAKAALLSGLNYVPASRVSVVLIEANYVRSRNACMSAHLLQIKLR